MSDVHFVLPSSLGGPSLQLQMIAVQGATAALVAQIDKGNLHPDQPERNTAYIKLVKAALLEGTESVTGKPTASAG